MKVGDILQTNSYKAQLNSPEWKSFASSIRKARGNACECCRQSNVATQVHHIVSDPSLKLHEYDPQDMMVLCASCRTQLHQHLSNFRRYVFKHLRPEHFQVLNGALKIGLTYCKPLEFVHAIAEMASSPHSVKRFAYAWNGGKEPEIEASYQPTKNAVTEDEELRAQRSPQI